MQKIEARSQSGGRVEVPVSSLEGLHDRIGGDVVLPDDTDYEAARLVWNGMIDHRPAVIVKCEGAADVAAAIRTAREHDMRISVRGGGHNVAGNAVLDGAMTLDLTRMRHVDVDRETSTVFAEGGAKIGDVDEATQKYGLAVPMGVVSATGIAGLTLHGGYGWLSRRHGLSADNMIGAEVVTAAGERLRAAPDENADLYWALRGGGGNFGVVTTFEYMAHPVGPEVWLAATMYPATEGRAALEFFRDFMADAPEELGAIAVFWNAPDEAPVPKSKRGKPIVMFLGCYSGPVEKGEAAIRPLREFAEPIADLSGEMSFRDVQTFLDPDYPDGQYYYWKSIYLPQLSDASISAIVNHSSRRPSPISSVDVWGLGGAIERMEANATPIAHRHAPFMLGLEANWTDADRSEENVEWTRTVYDDMRRYSNGGTYLNFPGFAEEDDMIRKAYGDKYERLRRVKAKYDPENIFQGNFNIPPA